MKKLHYKIALLSSAFGLVVLAVGVFVLYYYISRNDRDNVEYSLNSVTKEISMIIDNKLELMDNQAVTFISNQDMIRCLKNLTYSDDRNEDYEASVQNSLMEIRRYVDSSFVSGNYYRFCAFTRSGNLFSGNEDRVLNPEVIAGRIEKLDWLDEVEEAAGRRVILPLHKDSWSQKEGRDVFSVARVIRDPGKGIGYVEVQETAEYLSRICSNSQYDILILDQYGAPVFGNGGLGDESLSGEKLTYCRELIRDGKTNDSGKYGLTGVKTSNETGWSVAAIQNPELAGQSFRTVRNVLVGVAAAFMIGMVCLAYYMASHMTKPLRELRTAMENMSMETMADTDRIVNEKEDEIVSLNHSFRIMKNKLNESVEREVESRSRQLQSHFNALQAQINPHFIHNMLNVVMELALEERPDDVVEVCQRISDMMRYSTASENQPVTIGDEITHTSNYLALMKERFGDKITYEISADENIRDIQIPRLIVQPIVENSFYHGFAKERRTLHVEILAASREDGGWEISIQDDGIGFGENVLAGLKQKIEDYQNGVMGKEDDVRGGIGSLGLLNTFARLELFYNQQIRFTLENRAEGGARVVFSNNCQEAGR